MVFSRDRRLGNELVLILLVLVLFRLPTLYQPIFDIDEAVFGEFANKILNGKTPYVDAIDNKPALNYYFFAAVYYVFGKNDLLAIHWVTTLIVLATAVFVFLAGRDLRDRRTGLWAALSFAFLSHIHEPKYISTNGETLVNLPLVLAFFLYVRHRKEAKKKSQLFALIGLLLGLAFLIRYQVGMISLAFVLGGLMEVFSGNLCLSRVALVGRLQRRTASLMPCYLGSAGIPRAEGDLVGLLASAGGVRDLYRAAYALQAGVQATYATGGFSLSVSRRDLLKSSRRCTLTRECLNLSILGLAALVPVFLLGLYSYHRGFLGEHLFWSFTYNLHYIQSGSQAIPITQSALRLLGLLACSLPAWLFLGWYLQGGFRQLHADLRMRGELDFHDRMLIFTLAWLLLSFYLLLMGNRVYGHYFIQLVLPLSLLCGLAVERFVELKKPRLSWLWAVFLVIPLLCSLPRVSLDFTGKVFQSPHARADASYRRVGEFIRLNSDPQDAIFAWGFASSIYYYADRECSSRFLLADFLTGRVFGAPVNIKTTTQLMEGVWEQFWQDMTDNPPLFFVDTSGVDACYKHFPPADYPELRSFVERNYVLERVIGGVYIYKYQGPQDSQ